jgi:RecB family endonuclease NucS
MDGNGRSGQDGQGWTGTEKELQAAVEKLLQMKGWMYFHMPGAAAVGNPRGWPDLLCFGPRGRLVLIELKTGTGKVSAEQHKRFVSLDRIGHFVHVCRSVADVRRAITTGAKDEDDV